MVRNKEAKLIRKKGEAEHRLKGWQGQGREMGGGGARTWDKMLLCT